MTTSSPTSARCDDGQDQAKKRRRRRRRLLALAAAAVVLPALLVVLANLRVVACGSPWIRPQAELPRCRVAIVLGAGVRPDGSPSPMLEDRLKTGVALYKAGLVQKLLLSGDHGQVHYDEVNAMRRFALAEGLPKGDVFLDHAGFSTYETMYRARDVFLVRDAIIVTQRFHLSRAIYIARTLGLDAWGREADLRPYQTIVASTIREWLARCKAVLQLHITRPKPRYLGAAHPITGDARATWDQAD